MKSKWVVDSVPNQHRYNWKSPCPFALELLHTYTSSADTWSNFISAKNQSKNTQGLKLNMDERCCITTTWCCHRIQHKNVRNATQARTLTICTTSSSASSWSLPTRWGWWRTEPPHTHLKHKKQHECKERVKRKTAASEWHTAWMWGDGDGRNIALDRPTSKLTHT